MQSFAGWAETQPPPIHVPGKHSVDFPPKRSGESASERFAPTEGPHRYANESIRKVYPGQPTATFKESLFFPVGGRFQNTLVGNMDLFRGTVGESTSPKAFQPRRQRNVADIHMMDRRRRTFPSASKRQSGDHLSRFPFFLCRRLRSARFRGAGSSTGAPETLEIDCANA